MYDNRGKHLHTYNIREPHSSQTYRPVWPSLSSPLTWAEKGDQVSSALPGSAQKEQNLWEAAGDLLSLSHWEHLYICGSLTAPRLSGRGFRGHLFELLSSRGRYRSVQTRINRLRNTFSFHKPFTSVLLTSHITTHVYMVVLLDLFSLLFILNAATKEQLLIFLKIWYLMSAKDSDSDFEQAGNAYWFYFSSFVFIIVLVMALHGLQR